MRLRRYIAALCLAALACVRVWTAETIIVGDIVDELTGEPIPNVNIHFRGTKVGTTSDETGAFALRVDLQQRMALVFSAVGYHPQRFQINPGDMVGLQVAMRERVAPLAEIVATPDPEHALLLLRRVREHRDENDRTVLNLTTETSRQEQLFLSHIQRKHLRRALWRSLQAGMIQQDDSSYLLPLYRETQSFRLQGGEMIPANDQMSQALVLSATDYSALLTTRGNISFYQPTVSLFGRAFLSPLAASGNLYYRYYLADSVLTDGGKRYIIHFRTRNPYYATFNGEMAIDSATYALRQITAYVPQEVSVNYLGSLHIAQTIADDNTLQQETLSAILDFAVTAAGSPADSARLFPTVLLTHSLTAKNINIQSPISNVQSAEGDSISNIQSPISNVQCTEGATDSAFLALDSLPLVRTAKWIATIATTGYIPTGTPVDIGHIEEILQVNHHEGVHLGLPFRTNARMSRIVSLEASVGYGFRDRLVKGMGRISVDLPAPRKNILQLEYRDGYVWSEVDDFSRLMRENSMGWGNMDFTSYAFEALYRDTLCRNTALHRRQLQFRWFADWSPNIETNLYIRAGWLPEQPATLNNTQSTLSFMGEEHSSIEGPEDVRRTSTGVGLSYAYQSLNAIVRFSWGEHKYDGYFFRRYAYSARYPVLYLGLEAGHWAETQSSTLHNTHSTSSANGSHLYAHLRLMLTHHAQLGMGGSLTYALQAGAIFGQVPAPMLWQAAGNQSYAYDPYRFTLLHNGEMMADKYVALHAEWNGQGILFNLIPGIRFLHLRELVEAKLAYTYLSTPLSTEGASPLSEASPLSNQHLYAELGIGIGNILRICDLYSVWSLVPPSSPLCAQPDGAARWAMRFRLHLGL